MAEKLSINIDLRASRHVNQQSAVVHKDKERINYAEVPVEFAYRYDRMFAVTVVFIVFIIILYFAVSAMLPEPDKIHSARKSSAVQEIIKEKNLLIAPQNTLQISSENDQRPIYLFFENIDVLEVFHSEPVIQQPLIQQPLSTEQQITRSENLALTAAEALTEPDVEPESPPTQSTSTSIETVGPETISPEKVSPEIVNPETVSPKIVSPEIVNTEFVNPETVSPEIVSPETVSSEIAILSESESEPEPEAKIKAPVVQQLIAPVQVQDDAFIQTFSDDLSRVLLVSNIYKKEPVNKLSYWVTGPADRAEKVYLFTQLDNSTGKKIEHQWWYQGKMLSNKKFTALGKRWRCYSSKNIGKFQQGKWMIKVLDENGQLLSSVNFYYQIN